MIRHTGGPSFMHATRCALALAAMSAALALSGCAAKKSGGPGGGGGGFQMPPMPVETANVHAGVVRDQFRAVGGVEAAETIRVVSEISGIVRSLPFVEGQPVARGAVLAHLDDVELAAQARRADALREQTALALDRAEKLFAQTIISSQSLDDAHAAARVAQAGAEVAKAQWSKTRITAPFAGVVGRRHVSPGAYLNAGDGIADLARIDVVRIAFSAPERYLSQLKRGAAVEVTTPAFPGETFGARVSVVDPILDPQTRSVHVIAEAANPGGRLVPGLSAGVALTLSERSGALLVHDEAIFAEGTQNFVYVVKPDSTVEKSAVQLGARDGENVEILGGVNAGVNVVSAGHQKLFPGAKVMPMPAGGPTATPGGVPSKADAQ
jgi:membrane fusion protein (multidrug efflux system)